MLGLRCCKTPASIASAAASRAGSFCVRNSSSRASMLRRGEDAEGQRLGAATAMAGSMSIPLAVAPRADVRVLPERLPERLSERRDREHYCNNNDDERGRRGVLVLNTTEGLVQRAQQGKDADAFAALIG